MIVVENRTYCSSTSSCQHLRDNSAYRGQNFVLLHHLLSLGPPSDSFIKEVLRDVLIIAPFAYVGCCLPDILCEVDEGSLEFRKKLCEPVSRVSVSAGYPGFDIWDSSPRVRRLIFLSLLPWLLLHENAFSCHPFISRQPPFNFSEKAHLSYQHRPK